MSKALLLAGVLMFSPFAPALAQSAGPTDPQIAHIAYTAGQLDIDASWGDYAAAYEAAGAAELETMINDAVATARTTYGG